MEVKERPKKKVKKQAVSVLPIARFAGDIRTSVIWNRMGYSK